MSDASLTEAERAMLRDVLSSMRDARLGLERYLADLPVEPTPVDPYALPVWARRLITVMLVAAWSVAIVAFVYACYRSLFP